MRMLIHIGYHKTATSWLQRELFLPTHGYGQIASHEDVDALVTRPHDLSFDPKPAQKLIGRCLQGLRKGLVPTISSELLVGQPFFGGRESVTYANRLKAIAPDAKILVTIRSQTTMLPSLYMQYLRRGGTQMPGQFFSQDAAPGYHQFDPEHFCYDRLLSYYQTLFDDVHVMTQESLRQAPLQALGALAAFAENDAFKPSSEFANRTHAPSAPEFAAPILRRINHMRRSTLNPAPPLALGAEPGVLYLALNKMAATPVARQVFGKRKPVSDHLANRFAALYAASNERLAQMVTPQLDLTGYPSTQSASSPRFQASEFTTAAGPEIVL